MYLVLTFSFSVEMFISFARISSISLSSEDPPSLIYSIEV